MDKRMLSAAFRERLQLLLAEERGGVAGFLRDSGIDRSALSQFRDPKIDRLPRAETPRRMPRRAASPSTGSSAYRTRPRAGRGVTPSVQIESTENSGGGSPIEEWRREAAGMKLRYVPSSHPDMLGLANELVGPDSLTDTRTGAPENVLASTTA